MKIEYFDVICQTKVSIKVKAKVAHFMQNDDKENEEREKEEKEYGVCSLDYLVEQGWQPTTTTVEEDLETLERERNYFASPEYRKFRKDMKNELLKVWDDMSVQERKAIYLRIFKEKSWAQIASLLGISRGAAQEYVRRGFCHIKFFLDNDIAEQDKKEKLMRMKREQAKVDPSKNNF